MKSKSDQIDNVFHSAHNWQKLCKSMGRDFNVDEFLSQHLIDLSGHGAPRRAYETWLKIKKN